MQGNVLTHVRSRHQPFDIQRLHHHTLADTTIVALHSKSYNQCGHDQARMLPLGSDRTVCCLQPRYIFQTRPYATAPKVQLACTELMLSTSPSVPPGLPIFPCWPGSLPQLDLVEVLTWSLRIAVLQQNCQSADGLW